METVDVRKEVLEEVELLGQIGYFTGMRVDKETVPEGMHCYELRHGDDWGFPVSVEESVRVNYFCCCSLGLSQTYSHTLSQI